MHYPLIKHSQGVINHAIGLAETAEAVALTSPGNPVVQNGLIITQLPAPHGIRVCLEASPEAVLHVGIRGQVYVYQPGRGAGGWEERLLHLVAPPIRPTTRVQVTVELPAQTLRAAASRARNLQVDASNPLELLGLASLQAAMALRNSPLRS
jgi:hypothetical protein